MVWPTISILMTSIFFFKNEMAKSKNKINDIIFFMDYTDRIITCRNIINDKNIILAINR